jgi:hypothetical protein
MNPVHHIPEGTNSMTPYLVMTTPATTIALPIPPTCVLIEK